MSGPGATGERRLLEPSRVGVAVDTAELTISGIDPAEFIRAHAAFVQHVLHALHVRCGEGNYHYILSLGSDLTEN